MTNTPSNKGPVTSQPDLSDDALADLLASAAAQGDARLGDVGGDRGENDAFMARLKAVPHQVEQEKAHQKRSDQATPRPGFFQWLIARASQRQAVLAQALSIMLLGSGYLVGANASDLINLSGESAYVTLNDLDEATLSVESVMDIDLTGSADEDEEQGDTQA